jgi:hypothetical protein
MRLDLACSRRGLLAATILAALALAACERGGAGGGTGGAGGSTDDASGGADGRAAVPDARPADDPKPDLGAPNADALSPDLRDRKSVV